MHELLQAPLTLLIVLVTTLTSLWAFQDPSRTYQMLFRPYVIRRRGEWYRFISHGLVHANGMHLLFNMYALWGFGSIIEQFFKVYFGSLGNLYFMALYLLGLICSSIYTFFKQQNNDHYAALGASGAVSAVVFSFILIAPTAPIQIMFIPINIPGIVLGIAYLAYSQYMSRQGNDNIGHDAHFWGAVFGFFFTLALSPVFFYENFIHQIRLQFGF